MPQITRRYYCPRCRNEQIVEYDQVIVCSQCHFHFEKSEFELYSDVNILSLEEKQENLYELIDIELLSNVFQHIWDQLELTDKERKEMLKYLRKYEAKEVLKYILEQLKIENNDKKGI